MTFSQALLQGLAPDGGLYVPQQWPASVAGSRPASPARRSGSSLIGAFAAGDALAAARAGHRARRIQFSGAAEGADAIAAAARARALPRPHGGVQGFRRAIPRGQPGAHSAAHRAGRCTSWSPPRATPAARWPRPSIAVPASKWWCCSRRGWSRPTQQQQLTCWGDNVTSLAVRGTFDDCQRLVKEAFLDPHRCARRFELSSANSINLGRLLPQAVYYAASSLAMRARDRRSRPPTSFPAAISAIRWPASGRGSMGLPIDRIVLAHNANRTVPDFLATGQLHAAPQHRDAGLGHGRRQSQQPGAPAVRCIPTRRAGRSRSAP